MTGSTEQCPYFFNPFLLPKVSLSATLTIITVLIAVLLTGLPAYSLTRHSIRQTTRAILAKNVEVYTMFHRRAPSLTLPTPPSLVAEEQK